MKNIHNHLGRHQNIGNKGVPGTKNTHIHISLMEGGREEKRDKRREKGKKELNY
jgi:hypothetical protein